MVDEGTHIIEPAIDGKQDTPVELTKVEWDGKTIEVPVASAEAIKESLHTMESGLKTRHETAMAEAKAYRTKVDADLDTDLDFYRKNNDQKAWDSYVPTVKNKDGGYKGDPSLLGISEPEASDYEGQDIKPKIAMTPDPNVKEQAEIRKELDGIKLQIARGEGQKSIGTMDTLLRDPKFNLASHAEVKAEIISYFDRTKGQQPTKDMIKTFVQTSQNSAKERNDKAGYVVDKTRYSGAEPSGDMPREPVKGIRGNIFGNQQDKDAANQDLTAQLGDTF